MCHVIEKRSDPASTTPSPASSAKSQIKFLKICTINTSIVSAGITGINQLFYFLSSALCSFCITSAAWLGLQVFCTTQFWQCDCQLYLTFRLLQWAMYSSWITSIIPLLAIYGSSWISLTILIITLKLTDRIEQTKHRFEAEILLLSLLRLLKKLFQFIASKFLWSHIHFQNWRWDHRYSLTRESKGKIAIKLNFHHLVRIVFVDLNGYWWNLVLFAHKCKLG